MGPGQIQARMRIKPELMVILSDSSTVELTVGVAIFGNQLRYSFKSYSRLLIKGWNTIRHIYPGACDVGPRVPATLQAS